jgi:hypothetical protein
MRDSVREILEEATAGLRHDPDLRIDVQQELLGHFEDRVKESIAEGMSEEEATTLAKERFGSVPDIAIDLFNANRHRMRIRALILWAIRAVSVPLTIAMLLFYAAIGSVYTFTMLRDGRWSFDVPPSLTVLLDVALFTVVPALTIFAVMAKFKTRRGRWRAFTVASAPFFILFIWDICSSGLRSMHVLDRAFLLLTSVACFCAVMIAKRMRLDRNSMISLSVLGMLIIPVIYMLHDSRPIDHDYSQHDVMHDDSRIAESYDTFMQLRRRGSLHVSAKICLEDYFRFLSSPVDHRAPIIAAWEGLDPLRHVLKELDAYPGFSDMRADMVMRLDRPIPDFHLLRAIGQASSAYAVLKAEEGSQDEAAQVLGQVHGFVRKGLPHTSLHVSKLIWAELAKKNIYAAYKVILSPQCAEGTLLSLRDSFIPLTQRDIALRNVIISDYLFIKAAIDDTTSREVLSAVMYRAGTDMGSYTDGVLSRTRAWLLHFVAFRRNRTLRGMRETCDAMVAGTAMRPAVIPADCLTDERKRTRPRLRNIGGWSFAAANAPSYSQSNRRLIRCKILSDLLSLEIGARLDEIVVLRDYYGNADYFRGADGRWTSVGPDGKASTGDDISLKWSDGS